MNRVEGNKLFFAITKNGAKIPSKRTEDAGYDVYACFDEDYIVIRPNETILIPTGIASACSEDYYIQLQERGSTGTKGMAQRCGVIDSGFRNEWFVPITNSSNKILFISKLSEEETYQRYFGNVIEPSLVYPYAKAICQAVVLPVPKMEVKEITFDELKNINSERGIGALGSSNK